MQHRWAALAAQQEQQLQKLWHLEAQAVAAAAAPSPAPSRPSLPATWHPVPPAGLLPQGCSPEAARRWGHAGCAVGTTLVVHGGYGGQGAHARLGDLLLLDGLTGSWRRPQVAGPAPAARVGHALVAVGQRVLLVGGRSSPAQPLGDTWLLERVGGGGGGSMRWRQVHAEVEGGGCWPGRFRHSAAHVASLEDREVVVVVGGKAGPHCPVDELWLLQLPHSDAAAASWLRLSATGQCPPARASHAAAVVDGRMYVYGGKSGYGHISDELYCLELSWQQQQQQHHQQQASRTGYSFQAHWTKISGGSNTGSSSSSSPATSSGPSVSQQAAAAAAAAPPSQPPPCFSHTLTAAGSRLLLYGGCPAVDHSRLHIFDCQTSSWSHCPVAAPVDLVPVRHVAAYVAGKLLLLGGGAFCFSFGTIFGEPHWLEVPQATTTSSSPASSSSSPAAAGSSWALVVATNSAKSAKDALKSAGWLDTGSKSQLLQQGEQQQAVALPLMPHAAPILQQAESGPAAAAAAGPKQAAALQLLQPLLSCGTARLAQLQLSSSARAAAARPPAAALREAMQQVLAQHNLPAQQVCQLLQQLPRRWEKLGDLALIPSDAMAHPLWQQLGQQQQQQQQQQEVWHAVAAALRVARLARQRPVASTGTRDSQAELLLGADGWVEHVEHGVTFQLDVTRCMYSSGNVTERARMGALRAAGETVVDLYCGIGYYTLPLLVRAGVAKVYACEWNPHALVALRRNLAANGVAARCEVLPGDCRQTAPAGVADRVSLGLLPSSSGGWQVAVRALKASGGWLHVHENVRDVDEGAFVQRLVQQLAEAAGRLGRSWVVAARHVERVKWYAPHVRHLVVDVECRPQGEQRKQQQQQQALAVAYSSSCQCRASSSRQLSSHPITDLREEDLPAAPPPHAAPPPPSSSSSNSSETTTLPRISGSVPVVQCPDPATFTSHIVAARQPVILRGLDMGSAPAKWTPQYLANLPSSSSKIVSAHVCTDPDGCMDWVHKNFTFATMSFAELVNRCAGQQPAPPPSAAAAAGAAASERYYLRALGANPRKEPAQLASSFPDLAADLALPAHLVPEQQHFSSVLRISSAGLRLWTHYDVMDNLLLQVVGSKQVLLWPPAAAAPLYVHGSSSPITRLHDQAQLRRAYPRFAEASALQAHLLPGDCLYIPALWFHNVVADSFAVSVNLFWRHLPPEFYERKDLYGNRDLVQANAADAHVDAAVQQLQQLPPYYRDFYKARAAARLAGC